MNWGQFKDPVSNMCLGGAVVASGSLTQEMAGSNTFTELNEGKGSRLGKHVFCSLHNLKRTSCFDIDFASQMKLSKYPFCRFMVFIL